MLLFNHALAGSTVAVITPLPLVAPVAFASHFLLDMFPHAYGEELPLSRFSKVQIGIDLTVTCAIIPFVLWLFPEYVIVVSIGMFFGMLPDFLWIFWKRGPKWLDKFLDWAHWIQWAEWRHGWALDIIYAAVFIYILSMFSDVI